MPHQGFRIHSSRSSLVLYLATRWVGITCYPHCGDEPAEAQGRQRTCLRSCRRYVVRGLGARRELGQQDLFLCQSMFIAQSKRIFLR